MFCVRNIPRTCISAPSVRLIFKARYSRRSDRNTSCFKPVKSNDDPLDGVDNNVFGTNSNWELLTPQGFRFYLPGGIGPGWLDPSTTAQVEVLSMLVAPNKYNDVDISKNQKKKRYTTSDNKEKNSYVLQCYAQECPTLLRKDVLELFPNCLEVTSPQLTIITISQEISNKKTRWSKEIETEKLAQNFVLAASDICRKLKMCGYWANFINPFSGQPYTNPPKNSSLYTTDERFRCLGFQVDKQTNCKIISRVNESKNFIGNLYTTAPHSDFLTEIMDNVNFCT